MQATALQTGILWRSNPPVIGGTNSGYSDMACL